MTNDGKTKEMVSIKLPSLVKEGQGWLDPQAKYKIILQLYLARSHSLTSLPTRSFQEDKEKV